ncbi:DegT/DnrJ/EryC1/StrS family aminotransferase [Christiangramia forsetii]|uniref:GDP-perosamine synthase n=2 Tax=Christiangramia forsetii TaxID=411153 RepID=A0LYT8_CHRFK|nr:DegT/DnrJ/EryC1/StrS family aminotransferase [Christiangramia forsetii]GGG33398.1 GDP-perosamine synthase [Christiangramia forsetii]CAL65533.1 SpsC-like DegT/DnrJ/EryC1/StrS family aminotransferase [Christiangramia forsetii KT0803]
MGELKYPVYQPSLNGNEKKYVNECLDSTWISGKGKFIDKFEKDFAKYIGSNHATGVCNGTVALHLALEALGIGEGDEVIVPTLTYVASVNAITYTGAKPVFVDSLETTWQIDPEDVIAKITSKTKAVLCVHLYGHPCEMERLVKVCNEYSLFLIEDCAEAIGSKYKGKHVGVFGDVATFSFYGNKTITTGEGGMVVTNDKTLYDRLVHLKGQGLAKYREYWHDAIGYNYRMTNICAAIGLAQLEQIDNILKKKKQIAGWYKYGFEDSGFILQEKAEECENSFWMCTILIPHGLDREALKEFLINHGVETRPMFYPVHTMPIYSQKYEKHQIAENLARRGINLPSYPGLSKENVKEIIDLLKIFK